MTKRELVNFIDNIKRVEKIDIDIEIDENELELYEKPKYYYYKASKNFELVSDFVRRRILPSLKLKNSMWHSFSKSPKIIIKYKNSDKPIKRHEIMINARKGEGTVLFQYSK